MIIQTKIKTQHTFSNISELVGSLTVLYFSCKVSNLFLRVVRFSFISMKGWIVMGNISSRLTMYFEEPFWVGVFERTCNGIFKFALMRLCPLVEIRLKGKWLEDLGFSIGNIIQADCENGQVTIKKEDFIDILMEKHVNILDDTLHTAPSYLKADIREKES